MSSALVGDVDGGEVVGQGYVGTIYFLLSFSVNLKTSLVKREKLLPSNVVVRIMNKIMKITQAFGMLQGLGS